MTKNKPWYVYIALCADKTYYTGITNDLEKRLKTHNSGLGSFYTRGRLPLKIIYAENHLNRSNATKREMELKKWPRDKKSELIKKG